LHLTGIDGDGYVINGIDPGDAAFRLSSAAAVPVGLRRR